MNTINIEIKTEQDWLDHYSKDIVNDELITYIINNCHNKNTQSKIIIDNKCHLNVDFQKQLLNALNIEYQKVTNNYLKNVLFEILLFSIGIIFLYFKTIINNELAKELLSVLAWVIMWKNIDLILLNIYNRKGRKKIIENLLNSTIIINN